MITYKTAESVTQGHPDKVCDQIADGILATMLQIDPNARVACEVMATKGVIIIAGEISVNSVIPINIAVEAERVARQTLYEIGYDADTFAYRTLIHEQSTDISQAVNQADQGAGDQGIMYGYACNETPELLPIPVVLAAKLTDQLTSVRKTGKLPYLKPDGKSQVTVEYENGIPKRISSIIISTQHADSVTQDLLTPAILTHVINKSVPCNLIDDTTVDINPSGNFVVGGPDADTGVTGRKLMVDTYGGLARHGGGAFSGKDPSKVDRSGAYFPRYVAKNIVAAGLADECEVAISYAIGKAVPTMVTVNTFNTGVVSDDQISSVVKKLFDFRPAAIIKHLRLQHPIYSKIARGCHFINQATPWEQTDKANEITDEFRP